MSTYADVADFRDYTGIDDTELDDTAVEDLLVKAERDVDNVLGPIVPYSDTGLKLRVPGNLTPAEAAALARAVSAQAEWRHRNPAYFTGTEVRRATRVEGPDFREIFTAADGAASGRYDPRIADELLVLSRVRRLAGYLT